MNALPSGGDENYAHAYPDELSGGMRQRVERPRAGNQPDILLWMKRFSALDPIIRTEGYRMSCEVQAETSAHHWRGYDLDEAMRDGDRIAITCKMARSYRLERRMDHRIIPANDCNHVLPWRGY